MIKHYTWTTNIMNKDTYGGAMNGYSEDFLEKIYHKLLENKYI